MMLLDLSNKHALTAFKDNYSKTRAPRAIVRYSNDLKLKQVVAMYISS